MVRPPLQTTLLFRGRMAQGTAETNGLWQLETHPMNIQEEILTQ